MLASMARGASRSAFLARSAEARLPTWSSYLRARIPPPGAAGRRRLGTSTGGTTMLRRGGSCAKGSLRATAGVTTSHRPRPLASFRPPLNLNEFMRRVSTTTPATAPRAAWPYCYRHWSVSLGGYGTCPNGHGKGLDSYWSPSEDD